MEVILAEAQQRLPELLAAAEAVKVLPSVARAGECSA